MDTSSNNHDFLLTKGTVILLDGKLKEANTDIIIGFNSDTFESILRYKRGVDTLISTDCDYYVDVKYNDSLLKIKMDDLLSRN